jgi:hypothetical protein
LLAAHLITSKLIVSKVEAERLELPCAEVTARQKVEDALLYVGVELNEVVQQIRLDIVDPNMKSLSFFFACGPHFFQFMYISITQHKCYAKLLKIVTDILSNTASYPEGFTHLRFNVKSSANSIAKMFVSRFFSFLSNCITRDMQFLLQRKSGGKQRFSTINFRVSKCDLSALKAEQDKTEKKSK